MILVIITFTGFALAMLFAGNRIKAGGYIAAGIFLIGFITMSFFVLTMPAKFSGYMVERDAVQRRPNNAENNSKLTKGTKTLTIRLVRENNADLEALKSLNESAWTGIFTPDAVDAISMIDFSGLERKEAR